MLLDSEYSLISDPREYKRGFDITQWRSHLRGKLFIERKGLSDLSGRSLRGGFDMHEGLFPRRYFPLGNKQKLLYSGPNCFLLLRDEHQPPPKREECYWLAVMRYGKDVVDRWVDSLPFRSTPDMPWQASSKEDVLAFMLHKYSFTRDRRQELVDFSLTRS